MLRYFINYAKKINSHEFREVSDTDNFHESRESKADNNISNKNEKQSKSTQNKIIKQIKNLEDENKSKNKIIEFLIKDIFWQTQTQNVKEQITFKSRRSEFRRHIYMTPTSNLFANQM